VRLALVFALGAPLDAFGRVVVDTGSISVIRLTPGQPPQVLATNTTTGTLAGLPPASLAPMGLAPASLVPASLAPEG
jgi:broad specificity phosphatase PhoE